MAEIVDFQEAAFRAGLKRAVDGTAPPIGAEQIARYAAQGAALIQKESGITPDDVVITMVNGVKRYGIRRQRR